MNFHEHISKRGIPFHIYAAIRLVLLFTLAALIEGCTSEPSTSIGLLPRLEIKLSQAAMQKVKQKRAEALARGMLESSGKDYVQATLTYQDSSYGAEVRLKGDWLDHLKGDKWSWRVKLRDDQAILGMDQFSLQHPRTRFYLHEWVLHQLLEQEDILTPRYDFVELWLNEEYKGIYAFESHFTEALLARQERPAGVILKFNEDGFWQTQDYRMRYGKNVTPALPDFEAAAIEPFQKKRTLRDSMLSSAFQAGRSRLNDLRLAQDGNLTVELIDFNYWARLLALIDVVEAYHALRWHNLRWYYHPQTTRLYPIGFDGYAANGIYRWFRKDFIGQERPKGNQVFFAEEYFIFHLFNHPEFREEYRLQLMRYTHPDFIAKFLDKINVDLEKLQDVLKQEFPSYEYTTSSLQDRARELRNAVGKYEFAEATPFHYSIYDPMFADCDTKAPLSDIAVRAFRSGDGKSILLQNYHCKSLQLEATGPSRNKPIHELEEKLPLPPFDIHSVPPMVVSTDANEEDSYVFYSLEGIDYWFRQKVDPWPLEEVDFLSNQKLKIDTTVFQLNGNVVSPVASSVHLRQIQVIPIGYRLEIPRGSSIHLNSGAAILCYGNADLNGTANAPIEITSSDGQGRGIHFLQLDTIKISHTRVSFNQAFRDHGMFLNGAMTCFAGYVNLEHLQFEFIDTEDALNIIHSPEVVLSNLSFQHCNGDGLDIDFSQGVLTTGDFKNIGGDAIDLSGSIFQLEELEISQIIDKGISIGEKAMVDIKRAAIEKTLIGIACKDGSVVTVSDSHLSHSSYGLAVFTKKNFFGSGKLSVSGTVLEETLLQAYVLENTHQLWINDKNKEATDGAGTLSALFYPSTN